MITNDFLDAAIEAARQAGEFIAANRGTLNAGDITLKQAFDFVTRVDTESEKIIVNGIKRRYPDHHFLAEESHREMETDGYRWIIDPLDGTTNYIHSFPMSAVSIALQYKKELVIGVVYDPLRRELFAAGKGQGAFAEGKKLTVSPLTDMKNALIATGFPFKRREMTDRYLALFKSIFHEVGDIRRAGSAALDLSYVACGRLDGFFEIGLAPWDCAAAALMITEAGGFITDFSGGNDFLSTGNIVAGSALTHPILLGKVKDAFAGIIDR
ncbi:MAG TPA: inositol monophosphatase family protein [Dissulfurispiraceae bacterium]|nr:inositol monophosphatase family protein [Dissulfurispiraceae bacterium]